MKAPVILILLIPLIPLSAQNPADARSTLLAADRALASRVAAESFAQAVPAAMAGNAVLVWPMAAVVRTPRVIGELLLHQPGLAGAKLSWQPLHLELARDSSLGLVWGVISLSRDNGSKATPAPRLGRFLAAWSRTGGEWRLEALAVNGVIPPAEALWNPALSAKELPLLRSTGAAGPFVAADSAFSARAGAKGASTAFAEWAAPDAVTFAGSGELNIGPARIAAGLAGDLSEWQWGAVAAGAATDGSLGWTVGQATITTRLPGGSGTDEFRSKYLTLWRRLPDGSIRFIADGGNARP